MNPKSKYAAERIILTGVIRLIAMGSLAFSLGSNRLFAQEAKASAKRPNVLFIAIDDLNTCSHIFDGETIVQTPNLEKLANRGVLFNNAHCAAPACNPSRISLLSGIAPHNSGIYSNGQDWRESRLKDVVTLPHHFQNSGYKTLGGGKIYHAASLSKAKYEGLLDPRPWDEYFPSKTQQMPYEIKPANIPMNSHKNFYGGRFDWSAMNIETDEMSDAKVVAWASKQLSKEHDKPLFLAVGIYRPHIPWWTPKAYFDKNPLEKIKLPEVLNNDLDDVPEPGKKTLKSEWHQWLVDNNKWEEAIQGYHASVSFADDMVGRLLIALENGPLAENTIIVLWSDHGYHLGQKQHWEKFALWEQTTRVPLIIAAPGKFAVGKSSQQAVSLLDIYPTLNELCGLDPVQNLDGESLIPLLKNPDLKTKRSVICTQGFKNHAVRSDKWRYIHYKDGSEELYDQESDSQNFHNLASDPKYAQIKQELTAQLPKHDEPSFRSRKKKNNARKNP